MSYKFSKVKRMKIVNIHPNITAFYFGADSPTPESQSKEIDWVNDACLNLGVASYAIHKDGECIVIDTLCSLEQAEKVKSVLIEQFNVTRLAVVLSHWHLHHIGGNAAYKNHDLISTRGTREYLEDLKPGIESGTSSWGPPPIPEVFLPNIVFDDTLKIYVSDMEVELRRLNIHSDDSLYLYIPSLKTLFAGDMVEDTIPFISNPDSIKEHIENYKELSALDVEKVLPNHCRLDALLDGGYPKEIIDSTCFYLSALRDLVMAGNSHFPGVEELMSGYIESNVITYWPPYEKVHLSNIDKLLKLYQESLLE